MSALFTVYQQHKPKEDKRTNRHAKSSGDFYAEIRVVGEVIAESSSEAIFLGKKVFKVKWPMVEQISKGVRV
jgi:hypothetical protein